MTHPFTVESKLLILKFTDTFIDFVESDERERLDSKSELKLIDLLAYVKDVKEQVENIKPINNN